MSDGYYCFHAGTKFDDNGNILLNAAGSACCVPTVLLRIEFTAMNSFQSSGGRLSPPFHPYRSSFQHTAFYSVRSRNMPARREQRSGMLKRRPAVYLCCTFPEVAFGGRYPLSLPCGARTFLITGLSAWPRGCPVYLRSVLYPKRERLSNLTLWGIIL